MHPPIRPLAFAVAAGVGLAALTGAGSASASPRPLLHVVKTLPGDYIAPLQFAVQGKHVYVADSAASALYEVGRSAPIARGPAPSQDPESSGDLAGVAVAGASIAYTTSTGDHSDTRLVVLRNNHRVLNVNLAEFERRHNPDGKTHYGVARGTKVSATCASQLAAVGVQPQYTGLVDSHPYAVTSLGHGAWAVADAGGNDVLKVDRWGHVSVISVLPSQPVYITEALASQNGISACAGVTYRFEPVPTDVETGPHGLYVTTLPGGVGGLGSVYRVGWGGSTTRIATGFEEATNLAIGPHGVPIVAELGVGLFVPSHNGPKQIAAVPGVAGVEWANGHLYASTAPAIVGGSGAGHIVVLR